MNNAIVAESMREIADLNTHSCMVHEPLWQCLDRGFGPSALSLQ